MNIYDPTFSSAQAATAAEISHAYFRSLLARKQWRAVGRPAEGAGLGHLFSIYDVLGYALAARLMRYGVDANIAFERAIHDFAHVGDPDRDPGEVFNPERFGRTLYVYSNGAAAGKCVATNAVSDPIELLLPPMHARAEDAVIIDLNALRDRVFHALGLDTRDYE